MSSKSYEKTGGHTRCSVTVYYEKTASGASFYFTYVGEAEAEWYYETSPGYWRWKGNSAGYVQMDVDGTYTNDYAFTYAKAARNTAGYTGGPWFEQRSGPSNTINLGPKNNGYVVTIHWTGSMSKTDGFTVTYTFTIPVYVNASGSIKELEKVYVNVNGSIKECTVYLNVGGTIKEIS